MKLDLHSAEYEALLAAAPIYRKAVVVEARQLTKEEYIETILPSGLLETTRTAPAGHWVITNPGGEEYVVSNEKFWTRYEDLGDGKYRAKGIIRAIQNPTGEDIEIVAPWGEKQFGDSQCMLASALTPDLKISSDRYIIGYREYLDTYEEYAG